MPRSLGPILFTLVAVLASIYVYNYFSDGGVMALGRNAKGGPGKAAV